MDNLERAEFGVEIGTLRRERDELKFRLGLANSQNDYLRQLLDKAREQRGIFGDRYFEAQRILHMASPLVNKYAHDHPKWTTPEWVEQDPFGAHELAASIDRFLRGRE